MTSPAPWYEEGPCYHEGPQVPPQEHLHRGTQSRAWPLLRPPLPGSILTTSLRPFLQAASLFSFVPGRYDVMFVEPFGVPKTFSRSSFYFILITRSASRLSREETGVLEEEFCTYGLHFPPFLSWRKMNRIHTEVVALRKTVGFL